MQSQHAICSTDSAELGGLVEELIQRLKRGETIDAAFLAANYPEAAASLVDLLPTIRGLVDLSESGSVEPMDEALASAGVSVERQLGDYRLIRQIGRGGMGIVYEAEQLSLGRRVALKVLPLAAVLDPRTLQRFKIEAQAAASLDHPNIVDVYGVGCERGVHYYAMRLINGCTLADLIAQYRHQAHRDPSKLPSSLSPPASRTDEVEAGAAPTAEVAGESTAASGSARRQRLYNLAMIRAIVELAIDVAEALEHAHEQGIVHRDIKPSNLMLDGQGKVWITDFGLAHIEANQSLTMTGDLVGTLRYMSPEQALAKRAPIDQRSDIYSLGATLYELLTLQPVIAGDDRAAIIQKIAFADPMPPRQLNPQIPADLETILLKMLEKDASSRYASAAELAEDLRRFLKNQPISARRPSFGRRIVKWSQRHRSLVTAIALAALAAVAGMGAIGGWWAREEAAQRHLANRTATAALAAVGDYQRAGKWVEALSELRQTEKAVAGRALDASIERQMTKQLTDTQMVVRLQDVRLLAATLAEGEFDFAAANTAYETAFQDYGIPIAKLSPAAAAELVERCKISGELADALTNWSVVRKRLRTSHESEWRSLLEIARKADPDPWRNRLRRILEATTTEHTDLIAISNDAPLGEQPPSALFLFLQLLGAQHVRDSQIEVKLRQVQQLYPGDFWIQFGLARYFEETQPPQWDAAVRHYSTALGIRPTSAAVHNNLGAALKRQGKRTEAIEHFREAISLQPDFAFPYANLGIALGEEGNFEEAVGSLRKALALRNELAVVHRHLGAALIGQGSVDEGIAEFHEAIAREPTVAAYHLDLGNACHSIGEFAEAVEEYRRVTKLDPQNARSHNNLGALLELVGQREAALAEYQLAIKIEPRYFNGCRNLARCLQRLSRFSEGLAELRRGEALVVGTAAKKSPYSELIDDAQQLVRIDAELPAMFSDESFTVDSPQAGRIARVLYYRRRYPESVRFFVAAFKSSAAASESDRYTAACVAVLAARQASAGADLPGFESVHHRELALRWLQDELLSWKTRLLAGTTADQSAARRALSQWRIDPDLASVRGDEALQSLTPDERLAWTTLWASVDKLQLEIKSK